MTYTFDINKTTKKNPSNNNFSKSIDTLISSNLKKIAPYLFGNKDFDDEEEMIIIPAPKKATKKIIDIDITIPSKKTKKTTAKPDFATFCKAFTHLLNTNEYADTYDFLLEDGTPIKLFSDEIQIGYELIPLNEGTKRIYDALSDSRKKEIIDIYINISK